MSFCVSMQHFTHVGSLAPEIWRFIDFQDSGRCGAILLPALDWVSHFVQKVNGYQQTKFRRHISIHGWDITTSVSEKQTSAILEFYIRFRFRLYHRKWHAILHQAAEFHKNRTTHLLRKYEVTSIFQNGSRSRSILLLVSYLLRSLPSAG